MNKGKLDLDKLLNVESNKKELLNLLFDSLKGDELRYVHSLSVADLAYKIAISNNLNEPLKFYFVGLIHDLCKNYDKEYLYQIITSKFEKETQNNIPNFAYHAFACPHIIHSIFEYDDNDIDNAIIYHCTGRDKMSTLEKIIFAADKIDPKRGYDSADMINLMLKDYKQGFIKVLNENRLFLYKKTQYANENYFTKRCYEYYLEKE